MSIKFCSKCGYQRPDAPSAMKQCCGQDMESPYEGNDGPWRPAMVEAVLKAKEEEDKDVSSKDNLRDDNNISPDASSRQHSSSYPYQGVGVSRGVGSPHDGRVKGPSINANCRAIRTTQGQPRGR